jgi:hypothetical protein
VLAAALEAEDWARVRGCRARMEELDRANFLEGSEKRWDGIETIRAVDGAIFTDPSKVEAEIAGYFAALFQGRHKVGEGDQGPVDFGSPFCPNFERLGDYLQGLPIVSDTDQDLLDLPVNVPDLEKAMAAASLGRSPGLYGLSYEFYRAVFG